MTSIMKHFENFDTKRINLTKYIFFTGKGGVGKTSTACAVAVSLADQGKRVLLISTDPASNLQDVFEIEMTNGIVPIKEVPNLCVSNLDPIEAAAQYREKVIAPFRNILPLAAIENMEEQLSGSCTVEIAAFNEFTSYLTDADAHRAYDHIVFDTAPTGHTLRMLQLPAAWDAFIEKSTHQNSCLGQLSGLEEQKNNYKKAVKNLSDPTKTTMILVARPEMSTLIEANRASLELLDIGIHNQILVINGILTEYDDNISRHLYDKQQVELNNIPDHLRKISTYSIPLRSYNITGITHVRNFLKEDDINDVDPTMHIYDAPSLRHVVDDLIDSNKRIIFVMGKGGVGKSSIASAIALRLADRGRNVHLASTDPAGISSNFIHGIDSLKVSYIDQKHELKVYQDEILTKARTTMDDDQIAYIEEDLRSPCTEEIAVFRAFARIVETSQDQVVVIDTAPTGHTLLLLDSTMNYHKEIQRNQGEIPDCVKNLLPKLRDESLTEVIIVSQAQTTPVFEAQRLEEDLHRANIAVKWWIINHAIIQTKSSNKLLLAMAHNELYWIEKVKQHTNGKYAIVGYCHKTITNETLRSWTA